MNEEHLKKVCVYWRTEFWGRNSRCSFQEWIRRAKTEFISRRTLENYVDRVIIQATNITPTYDLITKLTDNFYASLKSEQ